MRGSLGQFSSDPTAMSVMGRKMLYVRAIKSHTTGEGSSRRWRKVWRTIVASLWENMEATDSELTCGERVDENPCA
jgi:hypothetical protein